MTGEGQLGPSELRRAQVALGLFIFGLVISGVTAFPLLPEVEALCRLAGVDAPDSPVPAAIRGWLATVREGLRATGSHYPFLFYGTDWLAFGHLVIAGFFVPPMRDPVRHAANLQVGLWACAGVFVLAATCGPWRGIPWWWRCVDASFGLIGAVPLLYVRRLVGRRARSAS